MYLKAAFFTLATFVIGLGTLGLTAFYAAYPEAAPAASWMLIAAGALVWVGSLFLISRLPTQPKGN